MSKLVQDRDGNDGADAIVVGGGLAGLTAAVFLGRAGLRVTLYERSQTLGGRAQTQTHGDFRFNIGPHALYRAGEAKRIFSELGLHFAGGIPQAAGGFAVARGEKHALPGGFLSLLTTSLLRLPDKLELARVMTSLPRLDPESARGLTFEQWLQRNLRRPAVRDLIQGLSRVATYTNAPSEMCAAMTLGQMQMAFTKNVDYLDGGWQTMVDALRQAATASGVRIVVGQRIATVEHQNAVCGVRRADGSLQSASAVVLAVGPHEAAEMAPAVRSLQEVATRSVPVKAACLDLALSKLPRGNATFALGIDEPLYLSVHSAVAQLAAPGGALVHLAKYLQPGKPNDPKADQQQLEALMDLVQPGWRPAVVERRFLPSISVCSALVSAAHGGLTGRPGARIEQVGGLFIAGDWVGPRGMLVDASVASAREAARLALASRPTTAVAA